jgi:hypothetical protein
MWSDEAGVASSSREQLGEKEKEPRAPKSVACDFSGIAVHYYAAKSKSPPFQAPRERDICKATMPQFRRARC